MDSTSNIKEASISSFGIHRVRLKALEWCANVKVFTFFMCVLSCINGSIAASYLPAVITTMEQRFELGSLESGIIVSSYEVGATIAVIFVSYIGHHQHIPLILGWGTFLVGIGSAVFSIPHFVAQSYSSQMHSDAASLVKNSSSNVTVCNHEHAPHYSLQNLCTEQDISSHNGLFIAIFITAQTVIGVGSTPILTIGISYIDNHVTEKASSQYLAFVNAASVLGAVIGFGCGAAMLEIYIDSPSYKFTDLGIINSNDERWLGAWWAGFLIFAALMILLAPWFCAFPKTLQSYRTSASSNTLPATDDGDGDQNETNNTNSESSSKGHVKGLPKAILKLLKNPIYMLVNFGGVCEMFIVTGFITFVPKYLETQYDIKKSYASITAGALAIPGAVAGILFMGIIMKKFHLKMAGAIKSVLILNAVAAVCFILAFFVGCDNPPLVGLTTPYPTSQDGKLIQTNLSSSCNMDCGCDDYTLTPVCHNDLTYFSLCHAGCQSLSADQCSCIVDSTSEIKRGKCNYQCKLLPAFLVLLFVVSFALASTKIPVTMITIRCTSEDMKSFALGIQVVILRLLALLPAPIMFGAVIDSSCLWWKKECGKNLNCLIYNNTAFRNRFTAISLGFHLLGMLLFFIAWLVIRKNDPDDILPNRATAAGENKEMNNNKTLHHQIDAHENSQTIISKL